VARFLALRIFNKLGTGFNKHGMGGMPQDQSGFGFVVKLAERSLEAALAFRVRESQRVQRQRRREVREALIANRKRQRLLKAEALNHSRRLRQRLREERNMPMAEILAAARKDVRQQQPPTHLM
jgi:hypothetical protein